MTTRLSIQISAADHEVAERAIARATPFIIPGRAGGGAPLDGRELLCAALATAYSHDLYQVAARRGIAVRNVDVDVEAEFDGPGEPARRITYYAHVESDAAAAEVEALLREADAESETLNALRPRITVERRLAPDAPADVA